MPDPWDNWIPGVLSATQLQELIEEGDIEVHDKKNPKIDASSVDLSISNQGWRMMEGSVKPFGKAYLHAVKQLVEPLKRNSDGSFTLDAQNTYIFKLRERLPYIQNANIYGQATAKSSIGRNDVLARLIVDGMDCYESFNPDGLSRGRGEMFIEITPMTFPVNVKEGTFLSQLRLFYGEPEMCEVRGDLLYNALLHRVDGKPMTEGSLSVDLSATKIAGFDVVAFRAERQTGRKPINLWEEKDEEQRPCPCEYWRFEQAKETDRLQIKKNAFYILRSKELISVPKGIAVYCRANDETIGEMRIHYAGFVHPFFGTDKGNSTPHSGTPLIFEVRGHDVDVNLIDGEKMARLTFYRMSQDLEWSERYATPYNEQTLMLSKMFRKWPSNIRVGEDGSVERLENGKAK